MPPLGVGVVDLLTNLLFDLIPFVSVYNHILSLLVTFVRPVSVPLALGLRGKAFKFRCSFISVFSYGLHRAEPKLL